MTNRELHPTVYIYTLTSENEPDHIRYVGKTSGKLKYRLQQHLYTSGKTKRKSFKKSWISRCVKNGWKININLLEECGEDEWKQREIYWVDYFRKQNHRLTNLTDGGDSYPNNKGEKHPAFGKIGPNSWNYNKTRRPSEKIFIPKRPYNTQGIPIKSVCILTGEIRTYPSTKQAARELNSNFSVIRSALVGLRKTAYGCFWYQLPKENESASSIYYYKNNP